MGFGGDMGETAVEPDGKGHSPDQRVYIFAYPEDNEEQEDQFVL